jgi:cob(I)alamin adenosyltransferase
MIQVYTGNGKGKTTAALGLALRAIGAGKRVFIGQFVKGRCYSEITALKKIRGITLEQFGRGCFIRSKPREKDIALAHLGLCRIDQIIASRKYNLVILDEINVAMRLKLLRPRDVLNLIDHTPKSVELVLTGRHAPRQIIKAADLVSEIKEIKHYYRRGIKARKGIEH